jgi:hypothetical protein
LVDQIRRGEKQLGVRAFPSFDAATLTLSHSYDIVAIEQSLIAQNVVSDPSDVTYLVMQLRQLPGEARMYIIWALFFGSMLVPALLNAEIL